MNYKERGASAGFLGSKGKKFKETLAKQRLRTDKQKRYFNTLNKMNLREISSDLDRQMKRLCLY